MSHTHLNGSRQCDPKVLQVGVFQPLSGPEEGAQLGRTSCIVVVAMKGLTFISGRPLSDWLCSLWLVTPGTIGRLCTRPKSVWRTSSFDLFHLSSAFHTLSHADRNIEGWITDSLTSRPRISGCRADMADMVMTGAP